MIRLLLLKQDVFEEKKRIPSDHISSNIVQYLHEVYDIFIYTDCYELAARSMRHLSDNELLAPFYYNFSLQCYPPDNLIISLEDET